QSTPDASLSRLIRPTAVAECRPGKALYAASGNQRLMRRCRVLSGLQPLPNVGRVRRYTPHPAINA
ncbi:hypothetical protein, partial [Escherichia coli]|uniref:hypothetical protein n=1 Tax=Escherichia coli TaxID=562 RepID=UPI0019553B82